MADQIFNVNAGFFDAVNNDRTYSANDMNRPYKRVITNGVFATPQGTPSTDLQVVSAGSGMNIIVQAGDGIFNNKWFENPAAIPITVPSNTTIVPRMDSVIVQIDTSISGRCGNIVYRTGNPSSNPQAPAINNVSGVIEYRIANVYVASNANAINNDAITDLRGSSSCPWITSLIQQVDTSTLFTQYQTAYQSFYDEATVDYDDYVQEQREDWEAFVSGLTEQLTVSANVVMLKNTYTASASVTNIPIGIASFNKNTDILLVFINGLFAIEGQKYTISANGSSITLTNAIASGNSVYFVVLKSIVTGDLESAVSMIQRLDTKLDRFMSDSGWINFTLESGATAFDSAHTPAVRSIGGKIYLRGAFKGVTTLGSTICTLPMAYCPEQEHLFTTSAISGTSVQDTVTMCITTSGYIKLKASSGALSANAMIPINTEFLSANAVTSIIPASNIDNADEVSY